MLLSHPSVATVAVYPVRSELAEDEVMAALIAQPGHVVDPAELARYIDIVSDLPRTENGKVQKYKLRERGITATTWDRQPDLRARAARS